MPEESISKWSKFAQGAHTQLAPPVKSTSEISHGSKPGPVPHIADSLAYKIATVYTQRLAWQHGRSRHYRSMAEVRQHHNLSAAARQRPAAPSPFSTLQLTPSPLTWQVIVLAGLPAAPSPEDSVRPA